MAAPAAAAASTGDARGAAKEEVGDRDRKERGRGSGRGQGTDKRRRRGTRSPVRDRRQARSTTIAREDVRTRGGGGGRDDDEDTETTTEGEKGGEDNEEEIAAWLDSTGMKLDDDVRDRLAASTPFVREFVCRGVHVRRHGDASTQVARRLDSLREHDEEYACKGWWKV